MSLKEQFNVKHEIRARCLLLLIQILVSESILVGVFFFFFKHSIIKLDHQHLQKSQK